MTRKMKKALVIVSLAAFLLFAALTVLVYFSEGYVDARRSAKYYDNARVELWKYWKDVKYQDRPESFHDLEGYYTDKVIDANDRIDMYETFTTVLLVVSGAGMLSMIVILCIKPKKEN